MNSVDKIPITDYQSLLQEKQRLKTLNQVTELQFKNKWRELQNHYPDLILKPLLPFSIITNQHIYNAFDWLNTILFERIFKGREEDGLVKVSKFVIRFAQIYAVRKVAGIFNRKK